MSTKKEEDNLIWLSKKEERDNAIDECARGRWQRRLINGEEEWEGFIELSGKAQRYWGSYVKSRAALKERLEDAGYLLADAGVTSEFAEAAEDLRDTREVTSRATDRAEVAVERAIKAETKWKAGGRFRRPKYLLIAKEKMESAIRVALNAAEASFSASRRAQALGLGWTAGQHILAGIRARKAGGIVASKLRVVGDMTAEY